MFNVVYPHLLSEASGFSHESVSTLFSLNIYTYVQNLDNTIKLNALKLHESLPAHLWYMNNVLTQEHFYATNIFTINFTTQYTTQSSALNQCYTIMKKKTCKTYIFYARMSYFMLEISKPMRYNVNIVLVV